MAESAHQQTAGSRAVALADAVCIQSALSCRRAAVVSSSSYVVISGSRQMVPVFRRHGVSTSSLLKSYMCIMYFALHVVILI